jgi:hypothetical protein
MNWLNVWVTELVCDFVATFKCDYERKQHALQEKTRPGGPYLLIAENVTAL